MRWDRLSEARWGFVLPQAHHDAEGAGEQPAHGQVRGRPPADAEGVHVGAERYAADDEEDGKAHAGPHVHDLLRLKEVPGLEEETHDGGDGSQRRHRHAGECRHKYGDENILAHALHGDEPGEAASEHHSVHHQMEQLLRVPSAVGIPHLPQLQRAPHRQEDGQEGGHQAPSAGGRVVILGVRARHVLEQQLALIREVRDSG